MPVLGFSRQASTSSWFETRAGYILLRAEQAMAHAALQRGIVHPWLWFRVAKQPSLMTRPQGRGICFVRQGGRFTGDVRCGMDLPIATESIQSIIIQHSVVCHPDDLLRECARVLKPGGRIWVFVLNPYSPYRLHWRGLRCTALPAYRWRAVLAQVGLACITAPQYVGPIWQPQRLHPLQCGPGRPWQAACLLVAQKRTLAMTPLIRRQLTWHKPVTVV